MRRFAVAYTLLSMWFSGWLVGIFGLAPATFLTIILLLPALASWRLSRRDGQVKRRELFFLSVLTVVAVVGVSFAVAIWFDAGMDDLAVFNREYDVFVNRVHSLPEYKKVEVSSTNRKGGRVYLHGEANSKESHDRLITLMDRMIRYNASGYWDDVDYPGKSDSKKSADEKQNRKPPNGGQ